MAKKVTQQDIADLLNISRYTVSKVLKGDPSVSMKTRQLVLKKAADLDYDKYDESLSRVQKGISSKVIALVAQDCDLDNSYWYAVIKGVEKAVSDEGYTFLLSTYESQGRSGCFIPQNIIDSHPAGIIMNGEMMWGYEPMAPPTGIPLVFINMLAGYDPFHLIGDIIMSDNINSTYRLSSHLIELGHTKIGFMGCIDKYANRMERWLGFQWAMNSAQLPVNREWCVFDQESLQSVKYIQEQWERMDTHPSAVVCSTDEDAIILIQALNELGVKVPDQVSVTGFDNIKESTIIFPKLTTVHCDRENMGKRAVDQILWRADHPEKPHEIIHVSAELLCRDSTCSMKKVK